MQAPLSLFRNAFGKLLIICDLPANVRPLGRSGFLGSTMFARTQHAHGQECLCQ
jgi:hypothetical protein